MIELPYIIYLGFGRYRWEIKKKSRRKSWKQSASTHFIALKLFSLKIFAAEEPGTEAIRGRQLSGSLDQEMTNSFEVTQEESFASSSSAQRQGRSEETRSSEVVYSSYGKDLMLEFNFITTNATTHLHFLLWAGKLTESSTEHAAQHEHTAEEGI